MDIRVSSQARSGSTPARPLQATTAMLPAQVSLPAALPASSQDSALSLQLFTDSARLSPALQARVQELEQTLSMSLRQQQPALKADTQSHLHDQLQALETALGSGLENTEKRQFLQQKLQQFGASLQDAGLLRGPLKPAFDSLVRQSVGEIGSAQATRFVVPQVAGRNLGLEFETGLNPSQNQALTDARQLLRQTSNLSLPTGPLSQNKLILMGLHDELSRLLYERQLTPQSDPAAGPTVLLDQKVLLNTSAMVEQLLQAPEVPGNLLQDMTQIVETMRNSGGKGLQQALDSLNTLGASASQAASQINQTHQDRAPMQTLIQNLTRQMQVPDLVTPAQNVLGDYMTASQAAVNVLPALPFPLTMPVDIKIPTGNGGNLEIPAGTTLTYSAQDGYSLQGNGFTLNQGGQTISAGQGIIQLGQNLDQIGVSNFSVTTPTSQIDFSDASIQVDKLNQTAQIQAEQLNINLESGQIQMSNAQILLGNNQLGLQATDFSFSDAQNQISAGQIAVGQTIDGDTINTFAQLQDLDANLNGTLIQAGQLQFNLLNSPDTHLLSLTGQDLRVQQGNNLISMGSAALNLENRPDGSSLLSFATENGNWQTGNQQITSSAAGFQIAQGADGKLDQISALAADLNYSTGSDNIALQNGALTLNFDEAGQLSNLNTQIGQADWLNGQDWASITELNGQAQFDPTGQLQQIQLSAGHLSYGNASGQLDLSGGALQIDYGDDGDLQQALFSGDGVQYQGHNAGGEMLELGVGDFNGSLIPNPAGGQSLTISAEQLSGTIGSTQVAIEQIDNFQVVTGADGAVQSLNLSAPGTATVQTQALAASLENIQVDFDGQNLHAGIDAIQGNLNPTNGGLSGQFNAQGLQLWDTEKYTSLHLDSGSADFSKLGEAYGLNVQNLDLILDKSQASALSGGELRFEDLEAHLQGYTLTGTNAAGQQSVLRFGLDEQGQMLQQLALEIPKGGQISLNQGDDWFLKLGEQQQFAMTFDPANQSFTVNAHNLNAQYDSKEIAVDISGLRGNPAELQISVTEAGGIVIDDIANVSGKITLKGVAGLAPVEVDIDRIKGFSSNQLQMQQNNNGMVLHLKPDGPDSQITAEVRTSYNGIPLGLKLDNVHELKAGYQAETNRAQVYLGDPSGRGNIEIKAGPLKLEGSEIQVEARYHTYDERRMLNALDKLSADNGIRVLGDYLTIDPVKGRLKLDTGNERGPYLQTNFLFTSPLRSAMNAAGINQQVPDGIGGIRDDAFGFTVGTGARWTSQAGQRSHQLGFDVGLLPGSYTSIEMQKGKASLAGVPLPDSMTLGTTPYAGMNYHQQDGEHRFGVMAGAFANPAALAPAGNGFIAEDAQNRWGITSGVRYERNNFNVNLQYIGTGPDFGGITKSSGDNRWNHSLNLGVGIRF